MDKGKEWFAAEALMLRNLATMIDGFDGFKFYTDHQVTECPACARATVHSFLDPNFLKSDEDIQKFTEKLCPQMAQALERIVKAEEVANTVKQAVTRIAKKIASEMN